MVETATPGFEVAAKLIKQGFRGSQTGELVYRDCRVPAANLIGGENEGVAVVMNGLDLERTFLAPGLGGHGRSGATSCRSSTPSPAGSSTGRSPSSRPSSTSWPTCGWASRRPAPTATGCSRCAPQVEAGEPIPPDLHAHSAAAILYAAEMNTRVADDAVQIHGGAGYMWEMEINRLYRAAKLLEIGAGTSEIRRNIIAGHLRSTVPPV